MNYAWYTFHAASWLLAIAWVLKSISSLRGMARIPDLTRMDAEQLPALPDGHDPHVSVIVPACNEERTIEATLTSLLNSKNVRLEIIAVNDRSDDRTGSIMDRIAAEYAITGGCHEIRIVHIGSLPTGWLGKPHAMASAEQHAKGQWLLFTDADVLFHPRALELCVRQATAEKADHLVLLPTLVYHSIIERAMFGALQSLAQWTTRFWRVSDPRSKDFIGMGAFCLVRREVYTRVGGFEQLRMEVLEDIRFGMRVKRSGFAQRVAAGPGLIRIRWITGALAIIPLFEKNSFAMYRFRPQRAILVCLAFAIFGFLPLLDVIVGGWSIFPGLLTYVGIATMYHACRKITHVPAFLAIFYAPMKAIIIAATLRSMLVALMRDSVEWRGTRYGLSELRRFSSKW